MLIPEAVVRAGFFGLEIFERDILALRYQHFRSVVLFGVLAVTELSLFLSESIPLEVCNSLTDEHFEVKLSKVRLEFEEVFFE